MHGILNVKFGRI